jgi:hypothetical protein
MKKLGRKTLTLSLQEPLEAVPAGLAEWNLTLKADGHELEYVFDSNLQNDGRAVPDAATVGPRDRFQGPATPGRVRWRRSSSALSTAENGEAA